MIRERADSAISSIKQNAKTILTDIVVVFLALFYVFYNTLKLQLTKLNPIILLIQSVLAIVVGIMIKQALGENGFDRGYRSEQWSRERAKYETKAEYALPYIDKVDDFYEKQHTEKLAKNRKTRLSGYRMKYATFFDDNGDYIEHEIWTPLQKKQYLKKHDALPDNVIVLDLRQRLCLRKCCKLKIYVKNLFSEYEVGLANDERPEKTDAIQRARNFKKNAVKSIAFALSGVYVVASLTWNWGSILVAIFEVIGFIVVGLLDALSNYYYVAVEKVNILKEKESDITKFLIEIEGRDSVKEKFAPKKEEEPQEKEIEVSIEKAKELGLLKDETQRT